MRTPPLHATQSLGQKIGFDARRLISLGDSLSDVGTYRVGTVAELGGAQHESGRWTINAPPGEAVLWVEHLARQLGLPLPRAAETGFCPNLPGIIGEAPRAHPDATNYAQGGARVESPLGSHALAWQAPPFALQTLGLMARPLTQQWAEHCRRAAQAGLPPCQPGDWVTVWGGANDLFIELDRAVGVMSQQPTLAQKPEQALAAMQQAASRLGALVGDILQASMPAPATSTPAANTRATNRFPAAARVLLLSLPDMVHAPCFLILPEAMRKLVSEMVDLFNRTLYQVLAAHLPDPTRTRGEGVPVAKRLLWVDLYRYTRELAEHPQRYGLSDARIPACGPNTLNMPLGDFTLSVVCNARNTRRSAGGKAEDVSRYFFADQAHPTPYGHRLLFEEVWRTVQAAQMEPDA